MPVQALPTLPKRLRILGAGKLTRSTADRALPPKSRLYKLSRIYDAPEVTAVVERITAAHQEKIAACVDESYAL
jgi:hypothetical protein